MRRLFRKSNRRRGRPWAIYCQRLRDESNSFAASGGVFSHEAEIRPTLHLREKRRPRESVGVHAGEERDNDAS